MRFLSILVLLLFLVFAVFARWWYVCEHRGLCYPQEEVPSRAMNLQLLDENGKTVFPESFEQFEFDTTRIGPNMTANNEDFLDRVATYLKQNDEEYLNITAFYRPSERVIRSGFFENLGVARADRIRSFLVRRGIAEERITLDYKQAKGENLVAPLAFSTYLPKPDDFDKVAFTFTNMTYSDANFEYNSAKFQPGQQLKSYADSVRTFLQLHPQKLLRIIGHTDSIGSDAYNDNLGMERARAARSYFKKLGVNNEVEVATAGKRRPVAPNSTKLGRDNPEGRQKNRRVNFVIEDI
ncbi:MAG: OmpA family protein [Bacteroidota bacterium]